MESELAQMSDFIEYPPVGTKSESVDDSQMVLDSELPQESQFESDPAIAEEHVLAMESQLVQTPELSEDSPMVQNPESVQDTQMVQPPEPVRDPQPDQDLYRPRRTQTAQKSHLSRKKQRLQNPQIPIDPLLTQSSAYTSGPQTVQDNYRPEDTQTAQNFHLSQNQLRPQDNQIPIDPRLLQSSECTSGAPVIQNHYRPHDTQTAQNFGLSQNQQSSQGHQIPIDPRLTQDPQHGVGLHVVQKSQFTQDLYRPRVTQTPQNFRLSQDQQRLQDNQIQTDPRLLQSSQCTLGPHAVQNPQSPPDHTLSNSIQHDPRPDANQRLQLPQDLYCPDGTRIVQNFHVSLNPQYIRDHQAPLDPQRAESFQQALGPHRLQDPQFPQDPYRPQDRRLDQSLSAFSSPQPALNSLAPQVSQFRQNPAPAQVPQHPQIAQPFPEPQLPGYDYSPLSGGPVDLGRYSRGFEKAFEELWTLTEEFGFKYANVPNVNRDHTSHGLAITYAEYASGGSITQELLSSEETRYLLIAKIINQFIVDVILKPETVKGSDQALGWEMDILELQCLIGYPTSGRYQTLTRISQRMNIVKKGPGFTEFLNKQFRDYWNRLQPILRPFLHDPNDASRDHLIDILCRSIRCAIYLHSYPLEFDINFPPVNATFDSTEHMNFYPALRDSEPLRMYEATIRLTITPRMQVKTNYGDMLMTSPISRAKVLLQSTPMERGFISPQNCQRLLEMSFGGLKGAWQC